MTPAEVPGVILTKGFDPHGRPISYALPGASAKAVEGLPASNDLVIPVEVLAQTVNAQMLVEGFAYPLLYSSTPVEHRSWLRTQAHAVRSKKLGVWAKDSSREYPLVDRTSICEEKGTLIYPKFFRRSIDYLKQLASGEFKGDFASWLGATQGQNDQVIINDEMHTLSQLFQHRDGKISCQTDVLDMVFIEK
jgi:hypothetical protein